VKVSDQGCRRHQTLLLPPSDPCLLRVVKGQHGICRFEASGFRINIANQIAVECGAFEFDALRLKPCAKICLQQI
jgi:hypothetical protein